MYLYVCILGFVHQFLFMKQVLSASYAIRCPWVVAARKLSLGQGNIFTSVCQKICSRGGGGSAPGRKELHAWGRGCLLRGGQGLLPGVGGAWWRPPGTATAAGGTHPTGMHSCIVVILTILYTFARNFEW